LPDPARELLEPLTPLPVGRVPRVMVVTLASGNYQRMGVEMLESAATYFCRACNLTLLLMTDQHDGVPGLGGRLTVHHVPWRPWPQSTISKCADVHQIDALVRAHDFVLFLDADMAFVSEVTLEDVWGEYVAVEHPYYPRNARGWCGQWGGDPDSTGRAGFDRHGKFTFCQYPYERNPRSLAYIPTQYGKDGPGWTSGNAYYLQGALFGGTGVRFSQLCATMAANVAADAAAGIVAQFHDESHLNALLLPRYNRTRVLGFAYMHPPLESAGSFTWVQVDRPRLLHRAKDADALRKEPTAPAPTATPVLGVSAALVAATIG
jgi:hypothetical protein